LQKNKFWYVRSIGSPAFLCAVKMQNFNFNENDTLPTLEKKTIFGLEVLSNYVKWHGMK
jgi:hypothetical protein